MPRSLPQQQPRRRFAGDNTSTNGNGRPSHPQPRAAAARREGALASAAAAGTLETLESRVLMSTTWYVAPGGTDSNAGTNLSAPFKTIQRAANLAQPGDTVLVRGGTYRETVKPARSGTASAPITFRPYDNEKVTVSGADVVTGWGNHKGSIYKATQSWDLGMGANQVFVDGQMMNEARWPNTTLDLSRPVKASADDLDPVVNGKDSRATLRDAALTMPDGSWDGAMIHIAPGHAWAAQTGMVTQYKKGELKYDFMFANEYAEFEYTNQYQTPEPGDRYYLTGKFVGLDAPTEWFRDDDGKLYLWTKDSDSPGGHTVEAKRRQHAFDLSGRSHITVAGFHLFAAGVASDAGSSRLRLSNLDARYVSHWTWSDTGWRTVNSGIQLNGTDSVVENSSVAFSAGNGIQIDGKRNTARNNLVRDAAYNAGTQAGILARGEGHTITRNTVFNTGRTGIKTSKATNTDVTYNYVHHAMLQTTDGGGIYSYGTDGTGGEIAYNVLHSIHSGGFGAPAIYLDNFARDHTVHHNVVWDSDFGIKLNPTNFGNDVYNNTFVATKASVESSGSADMTGTVFRNNIFTKKTMGRGAAWDHNLTAGTDPMFVGPTVAATGSSLTAANFRLRGGSPAEDAGMVAAPFTNGYLGDAPDIGALELGKPVWKYGADLSDVTLPPPVVTPPPAPAPNPNPTPKPVAKRDARSRITAGSYDAMNNVRRNQHTVGYTYDGSWLKFGGVNFGSGVDTFSTRIAVDGANAGRKIEVRVGSATGRLAGTLTTRSTGGWDWGHFQTQNAAVTGLSGVQDVYIVFKGGAGVANVDSITFS